MTKKDYKVIAQVLADFQRAITTDEEMPLSIDILMNLLKGYFNIALKQDNSRFDFFKFDEYITKNVK